MSTSFLRLTWILLVAGIAGAPLLSTAQTKPKPAAPAPAAADSAAPAAAKKATAGPFRGKLAALDKKAKTITVGKRTFQVTPATKMSRNGKPATLEDGVVGEICSGYVKPDEAGKLCATTITFGPKPATQAPEQSGKASGASKGKKSGQVEE